jgi:serpin B
MPVRRSAIRSVGIAALVTVAASAAALLAACASSMTTEPPRQTAALTVLPRPLSAAESGVLSASNQFSFALWRQVNTTQHDTNVFMSPLSASFALGMTLNGAANQSFDEMRTGLQLGTQPLGGIDTGYKSLIGLLTSLDPAVTMSIANSVWYRNGFVVNQPFLDDGANYFNAVIKPLDFDDVNGSLATINGWVNTQTKGKIPTILDAITRDDVMFLVNAIYFKGSWRDRFDPTQTQTAPFHAASGDQSAQLMHRTGAMSYAEMPGYQAVDLPYGNSAFTMTVLLPKGGQTVESVAASLDAPSWQGLTSALRPGMVDLYLPKVKMSWDRNLIPDLESLGMHVPFTDGADFSRMTPSSVFISKVKQKAFVSIDEEGTEAAAVTIVGVDLTSAPAVTTMRVDRPFIFMIRERLSGAILFMGKIVRTN